ncbi:hypothetical protein KV102_02875 [Mumia sp. zg.B53]|uniref:hypothetical protein n=1 Tax=Mumia sp. zg.B53 TaxID=2855449 RepID=UPI001C6E5D1A|nr:hypothetical protein [Mumia sp. zg.B53]MBW9213774.1 hypothetical protein [Mumia sp. zg.B53]
MMRRLALLASVALVALTVPFSPVAADAEGESETTARVVSGATLRWGLSNEVHNSAYAPGTYNFLSAGKIGNPGAGGQTLKNAAEWTNGRAAGWKASAGAVSIEKQTAGGSYAPATWSGLTTSPTGGSINPPTSRSFSDHQVVLSGGAGWADPQTGRASLSWKGSFSVVFYSGMLFFYVADPQLNVGRDGSGTLTATLSGYGSSLDDQSVWKTVAPKKVTLATFPEVEIGEGGVTVTPAYAGVKNGASDQLTTVPGWGSWPASFVAWLAETGTSSYWYTSGGAIDANKPPLPVTFAWSLGDPLASDPDDPGVPVDPEPATPAPSPGGAPTTTPPTSPRPGGTATKAFTVSDAQLRWGLSDEMSNSAFAPGTRNFFSAGTIRNPGRGGTSVAASDWAARRGNVRIEKQTAGGGHRLATWPGLGTTPDGRPLGSATNGLLSNHTVVIDGGTGTVDPATKTATIRWTGTFTVVLYSGLSTFTVTDPVLTVTAGTARLDGTLGGYASDREDASLWEPLAPKRVRLADARVPSLSNARGFSTTPRFAGVRYDPPAGAAAQNRSTPGWGAFPTSFVRFQERVGTAAYWYTSGAATDRFKAALPITVSYDADRPAAAPTSGSGGGGPQATGTTGTTSTSASGPGAGGRAAGPVPIGGVPAAATTPGTVHGATVPVGTTEGIRPVAQPLGGSSPAWPWWLGGGLVVAALAVTAGARVLTARTP